MLEEWAAARVLLGEEPWPCAPDSRQESARSGWVDGCFSEFLRFRKSLGQVAEVGPGATVHRGLRCRWRRNEQSPCQRSYRVFRLVLRRTSARMAPPVDRPDAYSACELLRCFYGC